jgi:peroxiredoxin
MAQLIPASFPILADVDHKVSETYGVFNLLGDDLTTPAVFVLDRRGSVVWSYIGKSADDRPSPAAILAQVPK